MALGTKADCATSTSTSANEIVLRDTLAGQYEIKATVIEDERGIKTQRLFRREVQVHRTKPLNRYPTGYPG
jgi:hypothetical protein